MAVFGYVLLILMVGAAITGIVIAGVILGAIVVTAFLVIYVLWETLNWIKKR